jgi:hypothetical protein
MRFYPEMLHDILFVDISLAADSARISVGNPSTGMNSMGVLELEH